MNENISKAAETAEQLLPDALATLGTLMQDSNQAGPVRVAAAKATIDYALKLSERKDAEVGTLRKLDEMLEEFRASFGVVEEAELV